MENEKNRRQLQPESHIKRKSYLNLKGDLYKYMQDTPVSNENELIGVIILDHLFHLIGKGRNSKCWIYAAFSIYLVSLVIYILTSFRKVISNI